MTEDEFWRLIDFVDTLALRHRDEETAAAPLIEALAKLDQDAIEQFEEQLAATLYRLDGRKYADNAGDSGQSDDGFLYARCFVVGCGRQDFEATVNDPTLMPKSVNDWFETLLYVGQEAWAKATGSDPDEWDYTTSVSYETGSNKSQ